MSTPPRDNVIPIGKKKLEPLKVDGMLRDGENPRTVCISFNRPLTNAEFVFFHETSERTAFLMRTME